MADEQESEVNRMAEQYINAPEVTDKELMELAQLYKSMSNPNRNLLIMQGNLLLASQNAERQEIQQPN